MPRYMIELVHRYYMCNNYLTKIEIPIKYRKRVSGREKEFVKFLDLIAYRDKNLYLIECRSFKNVKKIKASLERICRFYEYVDQNLKELIEVYGLPRDVSIHRLLVVEKDDYLKLEKYGSLLKRCGIELLLLDNLLKDIIDCAKREFELRWSRGEGDTILAIIAYLNRYYESLER